MSNKNNSSEIHSLSHTKWNCKYHIVFAPKYRRKVFYEDKRLEVGGILRELCNWKGVHIIAAEVCLDHLLFGRARQRESEIYHTETPKEKNL